MANNFTSHYSNSMNPIELSEIADDFTKKLLHLFPCSNFVLCYSGMSGITSATILGLKLQVVDRLAGMMYVRKTHEKSHGIPVEIQSFDLKNKYKAIRPLFVDDFVSGGDTFRYVVKQVRGTRKPWKSVNNFPKEKWWCALFDPEMVIEKYVGSGE